LTLSLLALSIGSALAAQDVNSSNGNSALSSTTGLVPVAPATNVSSGATAANTAAKKAPEFTAEQKSEISQRVALANQIVKNVEADAQAKGAPESWRIGLLSTLYGTPSKVLNSVANNASKLDDAHALVQAGVSAAASTPFTSSDLVFTPIATCRFIDTRVVGGPITTSTTFLLVNQGLWGQGQTYGGSNGCIPGTGPGPLVVGPTGQPDETFYGTNFAIAMNVTVTVNSGAAGYLQITDMTNTNLANSWINWPVGGTPGLANAGVLAYHIFPTTIDYFPGTTTVFGPGGWIGGISATAGGNAPQLIVDFFGYFSLPPVQPASTLGCVDASTGGTLTSGTVLQLRATCSSGYAMTGGACDADGGVTVTHSYSYAAGNYYTCSYSGSTGAGATAHAVCCQVPAHY
jgi:hypothetical protein